MSRVVFIADFFAEHVPGGGELNNEELIRMFREKGIFLVKRQSHQVDASYIRKNTKNFFIVANFCNLSPEAKKALRSESYVIYEHDHKYLKSRNPASYKEFKAPPQDIINHNFYKNAKAVLCQSSFHKGIVEKNLQIDNIVSLGGNLWSMSVLEQLRNFSKEEKLDRCSVMDSTNWHKNTRGAVAYCETSDTDYELIPPLGYADFLKRLGGNKKFAFFPRTPETLSRIVVEARMMGMSVVTNQLVGATQETWFRLKGEELIDHMIEKRGQIFDLVLKHYTNCLHQLLTTETFPKISVISTFHEGDKFLQGFLEDITSQTAFKECEVIFIDAASPGNERKTIEKYMQEYSNISYHRLEEKVGPTECLNLAIKKSRGEYLTFGLIDDRRSKDCLQILLETLEKDDRIELAYGNCLVTDEPNETFENNSSNGKLFEHSAYEFSRENMIKCLPGPIPMWRRRMHEVCGLFDTVNCNFADDWEMWLRAVEAGAQFKRVNKNLGLYLSGGRSQQNNPKQRKEEAEVFYKYAEVFGENFIKFKPYFEQFLEEK